MTEQLTLLVAGVFSLVIGSIFGYFARQSIAKRRAGTIEQKLQKKVNEAEEKREEIISGAKTQAEGIASTTKAEEEQRRQAFLRTEQLLLQREQTLTKRISGFEVKE